MPEFEKYAYRDYSDDFSRLFKIEKERLRDILPKGVVIGHIGSTAVPGLGGKGIIDILVISPQKSINYIKEILINNSWIFKDKAGCKSRLFFEKDYIHNGSVGRAHIQLTYKGSIIEKEAIAFRDSLINSSKLQEEYSNLKKLAAIEAKGNGEVYRNKKREFIRNVLEGKYD